MNNFILHLLGIWLLVHAGIEGHVSKMALVNLPISLRVTAPGQPYDCSVPQSNPEIYG